MRVRFPGYALAWGVDTERIDRDIPREAMNSRCETASHDGVSRPAELGESARNHEGTGCVCVSMREALLGKVGRLAVRAVVDRLDISARASERNGRL